MTSPHERQTHPDIQVTYESYQMDVLLYLKNISSMSGVMVRVDGMIVGFHHRQPMEQGPLIAFQGRTDVEAAPHEG